MNEQDYGLFKARLYGHLDRQTSNASTFDKILDTQYASSGSFRDANAARIVMEAGSGRTRAETNAPYETSAGGGPSLKK